MQRATGDWQGSTRSVTRRDAGKATDSARHATGDIGTGSKKQTTCNGERAISNMHRSATPQTTQETTCKTPLENVQHGTIYTPDNMQHATGENAPDDSQRVQQTTSRQQAAYSGQYAANNKRHSPRNKQPATCARLPATCSGQQRHATQHAACSMQRATCSMQRATWNLKKTIDNRHNATRQRGNLRHAADTAQKTAKPCNACNRQRATDSRWHARAREHTRHHRLSCATGSAQRASSSMREALTRQLVRNTVQTPHTSCNIRPVPQHAANTRGADNTKQALKRTR
jgi:hypothetical protein